MEGEREKMGAASLHHPHPLTEMLNLLSASLSLVAGSPICMQMEPVGGASRNPEGLVGPHSGATYPPGPL
ncbi:hypothetical protein Q5P01_005154 [Channa striata]|uniref:Uncharacterized protein n=1 Tax=Channa striata TaxID=64152 RepID=A0AA88SZ58_CHASR|nr:hypothetical protein Q5P01_005154 [Channa striata]